MREIISVLHQFNLIDDGHLKHFSSAGCGTEKLWSEPRTTYNVEVRFNAIFLKWRNGLILGMPRVPCGDYLKINFILNFLFRERIKSFFFFLSNFLIQGRDGDDVKSLSSPHFFISQFLFLFFCRNIGE